MESVVVSIGGSVFNLSPDGVSSYSNVVERISERCSIGAVVGGGEVARKYIDIARQLGCGEAVCDDLGISVTHLNAQLLASSIDGGFFVENHKKANEIINRDGTPIMGGTVPGHTTDAVAAVLAEYIDADLLVYATNVDGVYTKDPKKEGARRFEKMSYDELIDVAIKDKRKAGGSAVIDFLAARFIERSNIKTLVLDGGNPKKVFSAIFEEDKDGVTEITPDT